MDLIQLFLLSLWTSTEAIAPWLLFGFALSGLMRAFLPPSVAQKHLSSLDPWAPIKAALLGIPMPLCRCSVVPVSAHLQKSGAGAPASIAFMTSSPSTGLDSVMASAGLFGWPFAFLRVFFAGIAGVLSGYSVRQKNCVPAIPLGLSPSQSFGNRLKGGMVYAFGDLIRDTRKWLIIGLLLGALVEISLPDQWIRQYLQNNISSYFAVILLSIPMYACSTGSLPLAAALMGKGLGIGSVFLFLTFGPATNMSTLSFVFGTFGARVAWRWLGTFSILALTMAMIMDQVLPQTWFPFVHSHHHIHDQESLVGAISTLIFLGLIVKSWIHPGGIVRGHQHQQQSQESKMNKYTFSVPDMSCGNCARSIENRLGESNSILLSKDLNSKVIEVQSELSRLELVEILGRAGFPPVD